MDNSFQRPESDSDMQSRRSLIAANLHNLLKKILTWLADFIQLTEKEQEDVGIYLGDPLANNYQRTQYLDDKEQHHGQ